MFMSVNTSRIIPKALWVYWKFCCLEQLVTNSDIALFSCEPVKVHALSVYYIQIRKLFNMLHLCYPVMHIIIERFLSVVFMLLESCSGSTEMSWICSPIKKAIDRWMWLWRLKIFCFLSHFQIENELQLFKAFLITASIISCIISSIISCATLKKHSHKFVSHWQNNELLTL